MNLKCTHWVQTLTTSTQSCCGRHTHTLACTVVYTRMCAGTYTHWKSPRPLYLTIAFPPSNVAQDRTEAQHFLLNPQFPQGYRDDTEQHLHSVFNHTPTRPLSHVQGHYHSHRSLTVSTCPHILAKQKGGGDSLPLVVKVFWLPAKKALGSISAVQSAPVGILEQDAPTCL